MAETTPNPECVVKAFPSMRGGGSQVHDLYRWRGRLWLGLNGDAAARANRWRETGPWQRLADRGLMLPLADAGKSMPGFELSIPLASQLLPLRLEELSSAMLRRTALNILETAQHLDEEGWAINHLEPGQLVFDDHGRPMFLGVSAIAEKGDRKFPFADFAALFLAPLEMVAHQPGLAGLVRRAGRVDLGEYWALHSPRLTATLRWAIRQPRLQHTALGLQQLLTQSPFGGFYYTGQCLQLARQAWREHRHRRVHGRPADAPWTRALLKRLRLRLDGLSLDQVSGKWTSYHTHHSIEEICQAQEDWRKHFHGPRPNQIQDVLEGESRGTLLDLGANQGYFSLLASHLGFQVTALDTDMGAIDQLYSALVKSRFQQSVRPAAVDFTRLNPGERDRFVSDVVLALGFTHHMRLDQQLSWPEIAETLAGLTHRLLITEFKLNTYARSSQSATDTFVAVDYTLENFMAALEVHFANVQLGEITQQEESGGKRQLILCRK
jgi:SAM-dependent methyltransferase